MSCEIQPAPQPQANQPTGQSRQDPKKAYFGAKLSVFRPNILIILGGSKSSGKQVKFLFWNRDFSSTGHITNTPGATPNIFSIRGQWNQKNDSRWQRNWSQSKLRRNNRFFPFYQKRKRGRKSNFFPKKTNSSKRLIFIWEKGTFFGTRLPSRG